MHIIAPDASVRPYQIIGLNYMYQPVFVERFMTLEELAKSISWRAYKVERNANQWLPSSVDVVRLRVLNGRNKPLDVSELVAWGRRLRSAKSWSRYGSFVFRQGSVPNIGNWRGGSSTRNCAVQNERRNNALVISEDGEIPARAVRQGRFLPDSWDGRRRIVQRCWKSQHKGTKSWDRPARHGKAGAG